MEKSAHSEHVCEGWQSRMSYPFQLQQRKAVVLEQQTYCTGRNAVLLISYCLEMIETISTLKEVIVGKVWEHAEALKAVILVSMGRQKSTSTIFYRL